MKHYMCEHGIFVLLIGLVDISMRVPHQCLDMILKSSTFWQRQNVDVIHVFILMVIVSLLMPVSRYSDRIPCQALLIETVVSWNALL